MDSPSTAALVWQLSTRWRTETDRVLAPFGLTQAQYAALATLDAICARGPAPTQSQLARRLGLTAIYVSKLLRALARDALIERQADPDDSRALRLSLTAEGKRRVARARTEVAALEQRLTAALGDRDGPNSQAFRITIKTLLRHIAPNPPAAPRAPQADPTP